VQNGRFRVQSAAAFSVATVDWAKRRRTMGTEAGFDRLLEQVRDGSEEAVQVLVHSYSPHLKRAIRRRLNTRIRSKFDSTDFEQSVWATFFKHRGRLPQFETPQHLINFLTKIAEHKLIDEHRRRLGTRTRNVEREVAPGSAIVELNSSEARPSEYVRANDLLQRMLEGKLPERFRRIVELRLGGATHREIALLLNVDRKTIQRMLRKIERAYVP
jgi:RNA polymerase sigma-70 factor (ECF subfamily)